MAQTMTPRLELPSGNGHDHRPLGVYTRPRGGGGWRDWITTIDHKKIGILYGGAGLFFFLKSRGMDGFPGLAIATSTAAWVNAGLLFLGLLRRDWYKPGTQLVRRLVSVLAASSALAALLWYLASRSDLIAGYVLDSKFLAAVLIAMAGALAYGVFALVFGAMRLSELKPARKG